MDVKVCNMRNNDFTSDLIDSVRNTGFVVLTHHGIDRSLIRETQDVWREFFTSTQEFKDSFASKEDGNQGYKGMKTEKAVGARVADLKEFYHWRPGKTLPPDALAATSKIFAQLEDVGLLTLRVIDYHEDFNTEYVDACDGSDNTILRTLYYPALKDCPVEPGAVRAAAHEDINFITMLVAATAAGLEVKDAKGNWHAVPHEENSIVVNIGDMLQLASKGRYKSTTHRVVNPDSGGTDRISMPLFIHPHSETLLSDGFTAGDYLAQRIADIYQKTK
jgi:isopenicillin N synthase-like dioxygenase